jgi:hypothetical protein
VGIEINFMVGLSLSGLKVELKVCTLGNVVFIDLMVFTIKDLVIAIDVILNFSVAKVLFNVKDSIVELEILGIIVIEGVLIIFEILL